MWFKLMMTLMVWLVYSHNTDKSTAVLKGKLGFNAGCWALQPNAAWLSWAVGRNLIVLVTVVQPSHASLSVSDSVGPVSTNNGDKMLDKKRFLLFCYNIISQYVAGLWILNKGCYLEWNECSFCTTWPQALALHRKLCNSVRVHHDAWFPLSSQQSVPWCW